MLEEYHRYIIYKYAPAFFFETKYHLKIFDLHHTSWNCLIPTNSSVSSGNDSSNGHDTCYKEYEFKWKFALLFGVMSFLKLTNVTFLGGRLRLL